MAPTAGSGNPRGVNRRERVREILERYNLLRMPSVVGSREVTLNDTEETPLIHKGKGAVRAHLANRELKGEIVWNSRPLEIFDDKRE
jgi:hypothetical protein